MKKQADQRLELWTRLVVVPSSKGIVRPGCEERAVRVWEKSASRLHFNRDFRLNSQPLAACLTHAKVIGGRAWPSFMCANPQWEKLLALWANSTLGLIAFWWLGTRQQKGRVSVSITALPQLTVIDAYAISGWQLRMAETLFDGFMGMEFMPANQAWHDENRKKLDRAMLIDLLELPADIIQDLDILRKQWCAEPSVHGGKSTRPE